MVRVYRGCPEIAFDLLEALSSQPLGRTRLMDSCNLSANRFRIYFEAMKKHKFIEVKQNRIHITEPGYIFLNHCREFLKETKHVWKSIREDAR